MDEHDNFFDSLATALSFGFTVVGMLTIIFGMLMRQSRDDEPEHIVTSHGRKIAILAIARPTAEVEPVPEVDAERTRNH